MPHSFREFEQLAIKVLDECHNTDPEKASTLIEMKYSGWGDQNCLDMAAAAQDRVNKAGWTACYNLMCFLNNYLISE